FGVSERIHEMGIRMALGASHRDILNLVLADGVRIVVVGIAIGVLITLALGRVVASLLFGVLPNDASTLIGGASILCSVGMVACVIPALRAARVDPAKALRAD
ncbi:MAG: FtsX-like permease family protein, partial [Gemmatimonadaceae bacterium]